MARYAAGSPAIDGDAAYRALVARDERLDGRLYVGVTSTGVYCRPVCRVRTPRRENCRFYGSAAEAEAAGFRACLKCRPAAALPAWSAMDASRTLARQAARWLDEHCADLPRPAGTAPPLVARLAARLGVSERHLRRIFAAEHGVSPLRYAQARRLERAESLLAGTALPPARVALACGYASLRRLDAACAARHGVSPARWRRGAACVAASPVAAHATSMAGGAAHPVRPLPDTDTDTETDAGVAGARPATPPPGAAVSRAAARRAPARSPTPETT